MARTVISLPQAQDTSLVTPSSSDVSTIYDTDFLSRTSRMQNLDASPPYILSVKPLDADSKDVIPQQAFDAPLPISDSTWNTDHVELLSSISLPSSRTDPSIKLYKWSNTNLKTPGSNPPQPQALESLADLLDLDFMKEAKDAASKEPANVDPCVKPRILSCCALHESAQFYFCTAHSLDSTWCEMADEHLFWKEVIRLRPGRVPFAKLCCEPISPNIFGPPAIPFGMENLRNRVGDCMIPALTWTELRSIQYKLGDAYIGALRRIAHKGFIMLENIVKDLENLGGDDHKGD